MTWGEVTRAVLLANAGVLLLSAALILVRIGRGPSLLDRVVASDLLVTALILGIALQVALTGDPVSLPLLLSLSLVGFIGAVAVSRFVARDRDEPVVADPAGHSAGDTAGDTAGGAAAGARDDAGAARGASSAGLPPSKETP